MQRDKKNKKNVISCHCKNFYRNYLKRFMDFLLSLCALIILSPVLLIVALFVSINLGNPIFFKQKRPGLNEKIFVMYKFRTMVDVRNEKGDLLADEMRLTTFGKILRSTSLDELPELINILKGDMSIIGPRPLLVQYLPLYDYHQKRRHEVRPGLSGLAQVNGRNAITWKARLNLDVKYVDNITFLGDLKIIFMTLVKVFQRDGINSAKSVTMTAFKGNKSSEIPD